MTSAAGENRRVGHTERESAGQMLWEHHRDGRLTEDEYRERWTSAQAATTEADLAALFHDLPPLPTQGGPQAPPAGEGVASGSPGQGRPVPGFVLGLTAISGGVATVIFLVLGFAFGAWWWAWIVFLIPPLVSRYLTAQGYQPPRRPDRR